MNVPFVLVDCMFGELLIWRYFSIQQRAKVRFHEFYIFERPTYFFLLVSRCRFQPPHLYTLTVALFDHGSVLLKLSSGSEKTSEIKIVSNILILFSCRLAYKALFHHGYEISKQFSSTINLNKVGKVRTILDCG